MIAAAIRGRYLRMTELTRTARRNGWLNPDTDTDTDTDDHRGFLDDTVVPVLTAALRRNTQAGGRTLLAELPTAVEHHRGPMTR